MWFILIAAGIALGWFAHAALASAQLDAGDEAGVVPIVACYFFGHDVDHLSTPADSRRCCLRCGATFDPPSSTKEEASS